MVDMNSKFMQKIEELTLYSIDQDKQLKAEKALIANQQQEIDNLTKQLNQLLITVKSK